MFSLFHKAYYWGSKLRRIIIEYYDTALFYKSIDNTNNLSYRSMQNVNNLYYRSM